MNAKIDAKFVVNRTMLDLMCSLAEFINKGFITLSLKGDVAKVAVKGLSTSVFTTSKAKVVESSLGDRFAISVAVDTFLKCVGRLEITDDLIVDLLDPVYGARLRAV